MHSIDANTKLVTVANAMILNQVGLIQGCREICRLRYDTTDPDHDVFSAIRGIESETDHFPFGEQRKEFANEYLQRLDEEMEHYLKDASDDILCACREIIQHFK